MRATADLAAHALAFNIESFVYLGVALIVTGLRTYARVSTSGWKRLGPDDYLAWVGAIFHAVDTSLAYSVGAYANGLANNYMTDAQRASLGPDSTEYQLRVLGSKIQVTGWTTYSILIWSLKASMCSFFLRLTDGINLQRWKVMTGLFFIAASWIAVLLTLFLSCRPLNKMWQIYPNPGIYCQPAISPAYIWVTLACNVATDLYLLLIPIPMFFKSNFSVGKKTGLICLFGCGLFITVAAVLRSVFTVSDSANSAFLSGSWAVRESFVAVMATNLPMICPLLRRWTSPLIASIKTQSGRSTRRSGSDVNSDVPKIIGRLNFRSPVPSYGFSGMTFSDSDRELGLADEPKMHTASPSWVPSPELPALVRPATDDSRNTKMQITREVEVHVVSEAVDRSLPPDYHLVRGNFTSTSGPSGSPAAQSTRSSFFAEHVHQDAYPRF